MLFILKFIKISVLFSQTERQNTDKEVFKANRLCVWGSGVGNFQTICPENGRKCSLDTQTDRMVILGITLKTKILLAKSLILRRDT